VTDKYNYDTDFVRRNTHSNSTADSNIQTNVNSGPVTTATLPYIRGTSETTARILQPYNIRVAQKPITTLRRLLTNVNDKDKLEDRQGAVYKVKSYDCQATYIGGTGEKFSFWFQVWRIRREGAFYESLLQGGGHPIPSHHITFHSTPLHSALFYSVLP